MGAYHYFLGLGRILGGTHSIYWPGIPYKTPFFFIMAGNKNRVDVLYMDRGVIGESVEWRVHSHITKLRVMIAELKAMQRWNLIFQFQIRIIFQFKFQINVTVSNTSCLYNAS